MYHAWDQTAILRLRRSQLDMLPESAGHKWSHLRAKRKVNAGEPNRCVPKNLVVRVQRLTVDRPSEKWYQPRLDPTRDRTR